MTGPAATPTGSNIRGKNWWAQYAIDEIEALTPDLLRRRPAGIGVHKAARAISDVLTMASFAVLTGSGMSNDDAIRWIAVTGARLTSDVSVFPTPACRDVPE